MAQQNKSTDLATINSTIREWAPALKDFALTDFNHQHFFRSAILAISESEQLMECMTTKAGLDSLKNAMKRAFSTGLSLNPQEGKAAIIAYKGKASYQIMKEGAIEIVMRTGDVKKISVDAVYENDGFSISKSSRGDEFEFSPARKNRGAVDGFFCWIVDKDDVSHVKYMSRDECLEVRDKYSSMYQYKKEASPWHKSEIGMCKKTVVKAAIRDLYISPSAKSMFTSEDMDFEEKPQMKDITPRKKPTGTKPDDIVQKLEKKQPEQPAQEEKKEEPPVQDEPPVDVNDQNRF